MPRQKIQGADHFYLYQDFGRTRTLLFSNSLGADHTMWDPQVETLSSEYNLLRYDTRGHGLSEVTPGEYSAALLGGDVIGLLDSLGLQRVVFCGLSMGGLVGQWLLRHAPERFHSIVLCNTANKIGTEESWNERIDFVRSQGLTPLLQATAQRWFTSQFREQHPDQVETVLDRFARTSPAGYVANCAMVRDADFRSPAANTNQVPVLVISGEHDGVTTVEHGQQLADTINNSRHIRLSAAHLSNVEAAEEFNAHLLTL